MGPGEGACVENPEPLKRAQSAMADAGVDAVLVASPGLVAFLSGHVIPPHLTYPSRDGRLPRATLVLATRDEVATIGAAPQPARGKAIRHSPAAGLSDTAEAFAALGEAADQLGLRAGRVAVELAAVPAAALAALERAVSRVAIRPLNGLLAPAKAAKSAAEIAGIAEACSLVDAAQTAVRAAVRPGASELDLYEVVARELNATARGVALPLSEIQVGARTAIAMGFPTTLEVRSGELVMCDIAPRHPNGLWADSCSTVACGDPTADQLSTWRRLADGLSAGQELLRPGVAAGDVYAAIVRHAGDQPGHVGHGIGWDHFEEPVIAEGNPDVLAEGSVIALEPGRYDTEWGMRIEHAFRVTAGGGEPMTRFSLTLTT
jgi:Xaa-Pro dipeptidase